MTDYLDELLRKKQLAEMHLQQSKRELLIIDSMIEKEKNKEQTEKIATNSTNKLFYEHKIAELLKDHNWGLKTKEIYHLFSIFLEEKPNYGTFRSYLSRMKQEEKLYQDKYKKWHLKE